MKEEKTEKVEVFEMLKPGQKEYFVELLEHFDEVAVEGFLRDVKTGSVFCIQESEQHERLRGAIKEGVCFPLGGIRLGDRIFARYEVNPSFFE